VTRAALAVLLVACAPPPKPCPAPPPEPAGLLVDVSPTTCTPIGNDTGYVTLVCPVDGIRVVVALSPTDWDRVRFR
jgi:hypothetical protein